MESEVCISLAVREANSVSLAVMYSKPELNGI